MESCSMWCFCDWNLSVNVTSVRVNTVAGSFPPSGIDSRPLFVVAV